MNSAPLLDVKDLTVVYPDGTRALDKVSFSLLPGEILGVIGESGSGKSTLGLSILKILPEKSEMRGTVTYGERSILKMKENELRSIRGKEIGMVFQDTLSAFDPLVRIGRQIVERSVGDSSIGYREASAKALGIMQSLGVTYPESRLRSFPHELSGGLRQRSFITMTMFQDPKIIIMDEPTTALDVIAQIQLVDLIKTLRGKGMSIIFITHDIVLASTFCDKLLILYSGRVMEFGRTSQLIDAPANPYTEGLISATPTLSNLDSGLRPMKGVLPSHKSMPAGCRFWPRCLYVQEICRSEEPPMTTLPGDRVSACHFAQKVLNR